jgi:anaerobic dimethyl sulfoxide reductase subunit B (iron-sulfur subunit)
MQYAFLFDASRCTNCYTCEIACKQENALSPQADAEPGSTGPRWRRIRTLEEGVYPNASVCYISVDWENCKACTGRLSKGELPACVEACPSGAIRFGTADEISQAARSREAMRVMDATDPEFYLVTEGKGIPSLA